MKYLLFLILLGCNIQETEYLYDENDDQYQYALLKQKQECKDDAVIFDELRGNNLATYFLEGQDYYYIINQEKTSTSGGSSITIEQQFKLKRTGSSVAVLFYSKDQTSRLSFTITDTNEVDLINEIEDKVCTPSNNYEGSNLDSEDYMAFSSTRNNDPSNTNDNIKISEQYYLDESYPVFLFYYNGTITREQTVSGSLTSYVKYSNSNNTDAFSISTSCSSCSTGVDDATKPITNCSLSAIDFPSENNTSSFPLNFNQATCNNYFPDY